MADVRRASDRGPLRLVGAVLPEAMAVGLVLVVNSAVFADTTAITTRDEADEPESTVTTSDGTHDRSRTVAYVADDDDTGCPS